ARMDTWAEESRADRCALFARHHLRPLRYYTDMRRDLAAARLPRPRLPGGLRLQPYREELSEGVRAAHNDVFRDHWGSQPLTAAHWALRVTGSRHFRPGWSFVVSTTSTTSTTSSGGGAGGTDVVAGYLLSGAYEEDWPAQGFREGWTDLLGVRRPLRRRGVASALLTAAARAYAADGMVAAGLDVDSANPSGAVRLYTAHGYRPARRSVLHAKDLPA
ncbi:GNAT family N-acetyltransferase, partial [Kineococcus glutinatus]|uniref:GNAT family N-acetyltransferase n=1 Tax=Kineococcus glutinatus TaxID=1070872 RepID=UPI0031F0F88A